MNWDFRNGKESAENLYKKTSIIHSSVSSAQIEFEQETQRGCGLDVHQKTVVATVSGIDLDVETLTFGTFTSQLEKLKT